MKAGKPSLPILFISGAEDACRGGDKGFAQAVEMMRGRGYQEVDSRLYPGMRHEILNETGRAGRVSGRAGLAGNAGGGGMIAVVAGVVRREGRVLLCQRPEGKRFGLLWEFPGGKVEAGESPEAALERELREELDVETRTGRVLDALRLDDRDGGDLLLLFYESETRARRAADGGVPRA